MDRISWNQYFMAQSYLVALRSTCTRLMVGAVIVRDNRIIASGYNGSVEDGAHCIDDGCYVVDNHCVRTVHAEANALLQCARFGISTENTEIYVTHYPCLHCCKQLIQAGIKTVYYAKDYKNHKLAIKLFAESGIETKKIELDYLHIDTLYKEKNSFIRNLLTKLSTLSDDKEDIKHLEDEAKQFLIEHDDIS